MKTIYVNYKNTGVKTLRGVAWLILIAGLMATLIMVISGIAIGGFSGALALSMLSYVLLMLAVTMFSFGVCFALAYLSESAVVARKQREAFLAEKGIELEFIDSGSGQKL